MKKMILATIVLVPILILNSGCSKDSHEIISKEVKNAKSIDKHKDIRENVWNQLSSENKNHIKGTWKDASLQKITLRENMGIIQMKDFIGKEVLIIDYPSSDNPTIGGFAIYADPKSQQIIGYGYRD